MDDQATQKRATQHRIDPGFSVYLDLVRVVAALDVMIAHAQLSHLIPPLPFVLDSAPTAVIVFFVLSGYIIESTTLREAGCRPYAIHRIARISSVALPAVILSLICTVGFAIASGTAAMDRFATEWGQWWRIPVILTFSAQDWFAEIELPWNGPFWSLHFEVAYYVIYGLLLLPAARTRHLAIFLFCLLIGPKIILLFPSWWLGVALAQRPSLRFPSRNVALAAFFVTPVIIAAMIHFKLAPSFGYALEARYPWYHLLGHAEAFPVWYVAALLVGAHFVAARQLESGLGNAFAHGRRFIRWIAGYTFSIYLYHRPLQHLAGRFYRAESGNLVRTAIVQLAILSIILALGFYTEHRTKTWRDIIAQWLDPRTARVNA